MSLVCNAFFVPTSRSALPQNITEAAHDQCRFLVADHSARL
jgi:hypothetical protein